MDTIVISAFPCCGKSYAFNNYQNTYEILDSDSSNFSWEYRKRNEEELEQCQKDFELVPHLMSSEAYIERIKNETVKRCNPDFPNNYIQHIKENIGKVDFIFVSSHLQVRQALQDNNIPFCTVYPYSGYLNEWIGRMYRRGSNNDFINFQIEHWDEFTMRIDYEPHGKFIYHLGHNEYLDLDVLKMLYERMNDTFTGNIGVRRVE